MMGPVITRPMCIVSTYFERFEQSEELLNGVVTHVQEFSSSFLHPVF